MPRMYRYGVFLFALMMAVSLLIVPTATQAQVSSQEAVAKPFINHYWNNNGQRVLGYAQTLMLDGGGYPVQYFEKGRIEDHSLETSDPRWQIMYGRLTVDMMESAPQIPVSGSSITYGDLYAYTNARFAPPAGFTGGTIAVEGGVFVPYDPQLQPVSGYIVPSYFWEYINRTDLFPRGWVSDVGLPLTNSFETTIVRDGVAETVMMQAFERTILTYNPYNAPEWQVERANIGTDMVMAMGMAPMYLQPTRPTGPKRIEVDLTQQYLYAYEGDFQVYAFPVSTGKDGWETPVGNFSVFSKQPLTDMRGDVKGEKWFVPNVPHVMYFASGGYAIHGTYWHNTFGTGARLSHGCVNLPLDSAALLFAWAPMGTPVVVYY